MACSVVWVWEGRHRRSALGERAGLVLLTGVFIWKTECLLVSAPT